MLLLVLLTFAFSNRLLEALVGLPNLFPIARAIAAACPLVHTLWLAPWCRRPHCANHKSVAEAGADPATGPPYFRPSSLLLEALVRLLNLFLELGPLQLLALLCTPFGWRLGAGGHTAPS